MKTTRRQILDIAADALGLPAAGIRPEAPWEEYGGDSLAIVEMVLTVQEHFGITLQTAELTDLKCLDDLVRVVERRLDTEPRP
jgi:acyl carrier protein